MSRAIIDSSHQSLISLHDACSGQHVEQSYLPFFVLETLCTEVVSVAVLTIDKLGHATSLFLEDLHVCHDLDIGVLAIEAAIEEAELMEAHQVRLLN